MVVQLTSHHTQSGRDVAVIIIGALVWGMAIGWIGQMILGGKGIGNNDWLQALVAGALGSVVGGTIGSLLTGEGFQLKIGGIVASIIGAVIVLLIWRAIASRKK
jgi:uncharacterized membrane protein YeaQ/YmgE (transglycosylase-associated protein family)